MIPCSPIHVIQKSELRLYTREDILSAIRSVSRRLGGEAPGWRVFQNESGIRYADWHGKFWTRWGDALEEAGLSANVLTARIPDDQLLSRFAQLARQLGRVPVFADLRMLRRTDPSIADPKVYARFGGKANLVAVLRDWCNKHADFHDVLALLPLPKTASGEEDENDVTPRGKPVVGHVYLIKSGRHYKIGRSNSAGRREREIALQLPERATRIHTIETDDPPGIEAYWHRRFAEKRLNGEWFKLAPEDVRAFKRRKFQ